ncbi:MAG: hypothetical protein ACPGVU_22450, partial [Limisphaerales bacterium]
MTTFTEGLDAIKTTLEKGMAEKSADTQQSAEPTKVNIDLSDLTKILSALGEDVREGLEAWKTQDRDDIDNYNSRVTAVNAGLSELRRMMGTYMKERRLDRGSSDVEPIVDISGVDVSAETLDKIYNLIEKDPKS